MVRYVAFLNGINASGHIVKMDDIKSCFEEILGIHNVTTYVQSGNVLFEIADTEDAVLRRIIEKQLTEKLGHPVTAIIRRIEDLKNIVKNNPFTTIKTEEKIKLYVTFLSDFPAYDVRGSLGVYSNDAEYARVVHREVYVYSNNYGKTCFSNSFIEKKLGLEATTRNWSTVNKLAEL